MRGIHRGPVNSPHKWPVTRKMFPFDDVIMLYDKTSSLTPCLAIVHRDKKHQVESGPCFIHTFTIQAFIHSLCWHIISPCLNTLIIHVSNFYVGDFSTMLSPTSDVLLFFLSGEVLINNKRGSFTTDTNSYNTTYLKFRNALMVS